MKTIMKTLCTFWLTLFSALSYALTYDTAFVQQELLAAEGVADIQIEGVTTLPDDYFHATRSVKARVLNVERGALSIGQHLTIRTLGGEKDGIGAFYTGFPRLYPGHRYHVYLRSTGENTWVPVGFDRGTVELRKSRNYSRNRTDGSDGQGTGAFLFWDRSYFPLPYFISAPTFKDNPDFVAAIEASFNTWRNPSDLVIEFLPMGCSNAMRNENDGINNVILVKDKWNFDSAAIAITRNFYIAGDSERAGQILDTDILLNAVSYRFTTSGEPNQHDVQNIVTHEVGHFLGLGHEISPQNSDATMLPDAVTNETKKRTLKASDLLGAHEAYTGVGTKLTSYGTHCELSNSTTPSCLAVHSPPPSKKSYFPFFEMIGLVVTLAIGRAMSKGA